MQVLFDPDAGLDYREWARTDPKTLRRINEVIESARRTPFEGWGKPEPLRGDLAGFWSRRITQEHRLVYRIVGRGAEQRIEIAACRHHYD